VVLEERKKEVLYYSFTNYTRQERFTLFEPKAGKSGFMHSQSGL
jgi:hypothetical protein